MPFSEFLSEFSAMGPSWAAWFHMALMRSEPTSVVTGATEYVSAGFDHAAAAWTEGGVSKIDAECDDG